MSTSSDPGPELIGPSPLTSPRVSRRGVLLIVGGLGAFALAAGYIGFDRPGVDENQPGLAPLLANTSATGLIVPIDSADSEKVAVAIRALHLSEPEKQRIETELRAGRLRLGIMTVADWLDDDDDVIAINSAGFSQTVTIKLKPQVVVLPYDPATLTIAITGVRDGGDGGVELAVGLPARLTHLRPLLVGETVQVGLQ